jgi:hypothetical protein
LGSITNQDSEVSLHTGQLSAARSILYRDPSKQSRRMVPTNRKIWPAHLRRMLHLSSVHAIRGLVSGITQTTGHSLSSSSPQSWGKLIR